MYVEIIFFRNLPRSDVELYLSHTAVDGSKVFFFFALKREKTLMGVIWNDRKSVSICSLNIQKVAFQSKS